VELTPDSAQSHAQLGYALMMRGKNEEAAVEIEVALRLDPENQLARVLKSRL